MTESSSDDIAIAQAFPSNFIYISHRCISLSTTAKMAESGILDNYINILSTKSDAFVNGDDQLKQSSLEASKELFDRGA